MIAIVVAAVIAVVTAVCMSSAKSFGSRVGEDTWEALSDSGYTAIARSILRTAVWLHTPTVDRADALEELTAQLADRDAELKVGRIRLICFAASLAVGAGRAGGRRRVAEIIYPYRLAFSADHRAALREMKARIDALDARIDLIRVQADSEGGRVMSLHYDYTPAMRLRQTREEESHFN